MTCPLSNTVEGRILVPAASADLSVGYLAKINADGEAELAGVSTAPPSARFVVVDSDDDNAALLPIEPGRQVRVTLSGTCSVGDQLACTAAGKAILLASGAAGSCPILVAEEDGVDGQLVLCRGLAAYAELPAYGAADATKVLTVGGSGTLEFAAPATELPGSLGSGDAGKPAVVNTSENGWELSGVKLTGGDAVIPVAGSIQFAGLMLSFTDNGYYLVISGLPNSDPGVDGALWVDETAGKTLKLGTAI